MIQETSLMAYQTVDLPRSRLRVLKALNIKKEATNAMISNFLGIPINCVTPRMNELVKMGLVSESYKDRCPITGGVAIFWKVPQEMKVFNIAIFKKSKGYVSDGRK
jgi:predicted transcriptional regulator